MGDDLARASMYAFRALVGALRDAGRLDDDLVRAIQGQVTMHVNYADVLGSNAAVPPDPDEARIIRHGMWWLCESVAPTANYEPAPVTDHPRFSHEWPDLEAQLRDDE